jgi:dimeric dUTPase (all-alpha-NTP-PPase superfamily)
MTLGEQLTETSDALLELILAAEDIEQKEKLREQFDVITESIEKLVKENVKKNSQEYIAVTHNLNAANQSIKEAIDDLDKIAATIMQVAKVVEMLGKMAAAMP